MEDAVELLHVHLRTDVLREPLELERLVEEHLRRAHLQERRRQPEQGRG